MTTDNFCFYLQKWVIQTSKTGGQLYSDTSPFSIPWIYIHKYFRLLCLGLCHKNKSIFILNYNSYVLLHKWPQLWQWMYLPWLPLAVWHQWHTYTNATYTPMSHIHQCHTVSKASLATDAALVIFKTNLASWNETL